MRKSSVDPFGLAVSAGLRQSIRLTFVQCSADLKLGRNETELTLSQIAHLSLVGLWQLDSQSLCSCTFSDWQL